MYAQLLYEIISLQNIIMSKKRTFTYTGVPTLFVDFLSTPTFLVPTPVPCNRIPGVLNRPEKLAIPVSKARSNEFYICSNVCILSIYRDKNKR